MIKKKICILGPSGVGKTSLIKQFIEGIFSEKYLTSIGVKVDTKTIELESDSIQLMIWDIEGIDRYCGFQPKYLRGAAGVIIVVDKTRSQSLIEANDIFKQVQANAEIPAVLAINKNDLTSSWHWSEAELDDVKKHYQNTFITSAKTGEGVEQMFTVFAQLLME